VNESKNNLLTSLKTELLVFKKKKEYQLKNKKIKIKTEIYGRGYIGRRKKKTKKKKESWKRKREDLRTREQEEQSIQYVFIFTCFLVLLHILNGIKKRAHTQMIFFLRYTHIHEYMKLHHLFCILFFLLRIHFTKNLKNLHA